MYPVAVIENRAHHPSIAVGWRGETCPDVIYRTAAITRQSNIQCNFAGMTYVGLSHFFEMDERCISACVIFFHKDPARTFLFPLPLRPRMFVMIYGIASFIHFTCLADQN